MSRAERTGDSPRRAAFLQRMGRMPGPERRNGKPTPLLKSLMNWGASSKPDAVAKGKRISQRNANRKRKT